MTTPDAGQRLIEDLRGIANGPGWAPSIRYITEQAADELERLRGVEADAQRWQYVRQKNNCIIYANVPRPGWGTNDMAHVRYETGEELDDAVDAAIAASRSTGQERGT